MPPRIGSYRFGRLEVDGAVYHKDIILLPEGVMPNWWRAEGHTLVPGDLAPVYEAMPHVLIVGTGAYGRMTVPSETTRAIEEAGIAIEVMPTGEAVERYNALSASKRTAAALHLTC